MDTSPSSEQNAASVSGDKKNEYPPKGLYQKGPELDRLVALVCHNGDTLLLPKTSLSVEMQFFSAMHGFCGGTQYLAMIDDLLSQARKDRHKFPEDQIITLVSLNEDEGNEHPFDPAVCAAQIRHIIPDLDISVETLQIIRDTILAEYLVVPWEVLGGLLVDVSIRLDDGVRDMTLEPSEEVEASLTAMIQLVPVVRRMNGGDLSDPRETLIRALRLKLAYMERRERETRERSIQIGASPEVVRALQELPENAAIAAETGSPFPSAAQAEAYASVMFDAIAEGTSSVAVMKEFLKAVEDSEEAAEGL